MDWKIIWTLFSIFICWGEGCVIENAYLKKAFACKSKIFLKKQWRFDMTDEVDLVCKKNQHVWFFNAEAFRQTQERQCVTQLLSKKCKGQSACQLTRDHFLDRVNKNWTQKSILIDIIFACVERSISNLMLLDVFDNLPDPCLKKDDYNYEKKQNGVFMNMLPSRPTQNHSSGNLTVKFAEMLWMKRHMSRNREKAVLYVTIGITVGLIFLLISIICFKTSVKTPVFARNMSRNDSKSLPCTRRNNSHNNNNKNNNNKNNNNKNNNNHLCNSHDDVFATYADLKKGRRESVCVLKRPDKWVDEWLDEGRGARKKGADEQTAQVKRLQNVNLIVHQHTDGSICYLVEPSQQQQQPVPLHNLFNNSQQQPRRQSVVVPASHALLLQHKQQLLNLQQHNHHYHHHPPNPQLTATNNNNNECHYSSAFTPHFCPTQQPGFMCYQPLDQQHQPLQQQSQQPHLKSCPQTNQCIYASIVQQLLQQQQHHLGHFCQPICNQQQPPLEQPPQTLQILNSEQQLQHQQQQKQQQQLQPHKADINAIYSERRLFTSVKPQQLAQHQTEVHYAPSQKQAMQHTIQKQQKSLLQQQPTPSDPLIRQQQQQQQQQKLSLLNQSDKINSEIVDVNSQQQQQQQQQQQLQQQQQQQQQLQQQQQQKQQQQKQQRQQQQQHSSSAIYNSLGSCNTLDSTDDTSNNHLPVIKYLLNPTSPVLKSTLSQHDQKTSLSSLPLSQPPELHQQFQSNASHNPDDNTSNSNASFTQAPLRDLYYRHPFSDITTNSLQKQPSEQPQQQQIPQLLNQQQFKQQLQQLSQQKNSLQKHLQELNSLDSILPPSQQLPLNLRPLSNHFPADNNYQNATICSNKSSILGSNLANHNNNIHNNNIHNNSIHNNSIHNNSTYNKSNHNNKNNNTDNENKIYNIGSSEIISAINNNNDANLQKTLSRVSSRKYNKNTEEYPYNILPNNSIKQQDSNHNKSEYNIDKLFNKYNTYRGHNDVDNILHNRFSTTTKLPQNNNFSISQWIADNPHNPSDHRHFNNLNNNNRNAINNINNNTNEETNHVGNIHQTAVNKAIEAREFSCKDESLAGLRSATLSRCRKCEVDGEGVGSRFMTLQSSNQKTSHL